MLRQPLLSQEEGPLRGEAYLCAGGLVLVAESESSRPEVAISGLTRDQQEVDVKVAPVMTDLTRVRAQQAGHIN